MRALLSPRAYSHAVDRVELIETHISWVLLAGDRVYKVKKPVDLGFLDFTTLTRRRRFCREEVRLNRRLTSDVYLGVVGITGRPPRVRVGGRGRAIEVAVAMRRLPANRMLDRLVRAGAAEPALLEAIGHVVARFHAGAATGGEIDELAGLPTIHRNWAENFEQTADFGEALLRPAWRRQLRSYVDAFLDAGAARFAVRVASGHARDCHGDLQAAHVCCVDPLQIFDCIEFNHRFRYADTASEIAFLAMDLDRLGRPDLAMRFVNAYLEASHDYDAVPLLDFYRAYRAFVRGKVLGFQAAARPDAAREARDDFALAVRYTEPRVGARLLVTSGVVGSGKSTVARALAARIGAIVVRTDAVRKHLAGVPLTARTGAGLDQGLYAPEMGERTYAEAFRIARELLGAGWSVVIDGAFATAARRDAARRLARQAAAPFTVLWCDAPDPVLAERLRRREGDPTEVSDAGAALLAAHRERYEAPAKEPDVVAIDTSRDTASLVERAVSRRA
ncbi:MAG: AAA family ATPase [Candidatus Rokubacteria bacterium]|nr:AAA family ATPase [Candidatus Rokubacteria bacterium]